MAELGSFELLEVCSGKLCLHLPVVTHKWRIVEPYAKDLGLWVNVVVGAFFVVVLHNSVLA